jgi:protein-S-isoprenylcysteine O-methyltransferase Ste14
MPVWVDWALPLLWLSWAAYWILAAIGSRSRKRTEPRLSRLAHILLVISAFLLLFFEPLRIGVLGQRVLSSGVAIHISALCLVAAGLSLAAWARIRLGQHWSGAIAITRDQRLIEVGPYAFVRHPIYSGLLVAILGSAIAVDELGAMLAVPIAFFAYWRKTRIEEKWLVCEFGQQYESYRRRVGALLPFRPLLSGQRDKLAARRRYLSDPAELGATIDRLCSIGELSSERAELLHRELPATISRSSYVLRHLGAHLTIGLIFAFDIIPLPLGTVSRVLWVAANRVYEWALGSDDRAQVHSFQVLVVAAIPWVGYGAYLLPLRRQSAAAAWLYAQHLSFSLYGESFEEFLAKKPRVVRRVGAWLVPPISEAPRRHPASP